MKPSTARFLSKIASVDVKDNFASVASPSDNVQRVELRNNNSKTVILVSFLQ